MVEKKKSANAETKKPSVREIAELYIASTAGAIEKLPPEHAGEYWRGKLAEVFGGPEEAKAALKKEIANRGGLIYRGKLLTDTESFEAYAENLFNASPNVQLHMLDMTLDEKDAYKSVLVENGKSVKYDPKKALEISRSRAEAGTKALSRKLKRDFKLGDDEGRALEARLMATYLDVYSKSAEELSKVEGSPIQHYFHSRQLETASGANVAKDAFKLMEPYAIKDYMAVQDAGKTAAATPAKKAAKGK